MARFAAADLLREVCAERFRSVELAVAVGLALRTTAAAASAPPTTRPRSTTSRSAARPPSTTSQRPSPPVLAIDVTEWRGWSARPRTSKGSHDAGSEGQGPCQRGQEPPPSQPVFDQSANGGRRPYLDGEAAAKLFGTAGVVDVAVGENDQAGALFGLLELLSSARRALGCPAVDQDEPDVDLRRFCAARSAQSNCSCPSMASRTQRPDRPLLGRCTRAPGTPLLVRR